MKMNDKVIEFYLQVADELFHGREWCVTGVEAPLRRFAALVAAAEREACVRACNTVLERMHEEGEGPTGNIGWVKNCIYAIRARGEK